MQWTILMMKKLQHEWGWWLGKNSSTWNGSRLWKCKTILFFPTTTTSWLPSPPSPWLASPAAPSLSSFSLFQVIRSPGHITQVGAQKDGEGGEGGSLLSIFVACSSLHQGASGFSRDWGGRRVSRKMFKFPLHIMSKARKFELMLHSESFVQRTEDGT